MKKKIIKNQIGDVFGDLIIINFINKKKRRIAICKCICGNLINRLSSNLKIYNNCKCTPNWKKNRIGLISKTFFYRIKSGAKKRNLKFEISMKYIWNLYLKQNKKCALTGLLITFGEKGPHSRGTASLDRIDSSIGYIKNNIQWVHKNINMMKLELSQDQFIKYCKLISSKN